MDIKPITREEMYLAKAAGQDVSLPEPITRKEMFLAKIAGMEVETPGTITRLEMFANEVAVALNRSVIEPLEITENGTYTAPEGVAGYNPVTVDVPAPEIILQDKTINENGEYTADEGFDGLGKVSVNVAGSSGGITIEQIAAGRVAGSFYSEDITEIVDYGLAMQDITKLDVPNLTTVGNYALYHCSLLESITVNKVKSIGQFAFANCRNLTKLDFGTAINSQIGKSAFSTQGSELHVIIRNTSMIPDAFSTSNYIMGNTSHYLYVPSALVSTWKNSNYMKSYHQSCVRAIEDYPEICG